ncbi:MAG: nickel-dependent hydrogenase large subunit [Nitrososphaerota archaeon]|nr:nickel-dependent hydrogenase large subunit [Candidatus Bathyarchaeota archaeon]MDW8023530.1 nickel-dependent hydrogenase large subunit [Nitrososphaerota archaeon]
MVAEEPDETKDVEVGYNRLRIPFGPVHPALKEPVSLRVTVRREEILDVDIVLGHVHRGIEALAENRNLVQTLYLVERICGICSHSHTTCYVQALEEIGGIKPSERALYLRTLIFELERIHSHLFLLGVLAYEIGFDTLFMFTWHVRESILDLFEKITGNRVHHSMNTIGGVRWDIDKTRVEELASTMKSLQKSVQQIYDFFQDKSVEKRLCNVGLLSGDEARRLCVVGPTARGSGVNMDVRRDHPYAAYNDLKGDFSIIVREKGDVYARTEVRILELFESINIIQKILEKLPEGPIRVEDNVIKLMRRIPQGEALSLVEAPRGELLYFAKTDGKGGLSRLKIRTPTIPNVLSLKPMLVGCEIADIPVVAASIDPCMACANRIVFVDVATEEERIIDGSVLRRRR